MKNKKTQKDKWGGRPPKCPHCGSNDINACQNIVVGRKVCSIPDKGEPLLSTIIELETAQLDDTPTTEIPYLCMGCSQELKADEL